MDNFNILVSGGMQKEDLVGDGWTDIIRNILLLGRSSAAEGANLAELAELADFKKMEQIRSRVDEIVTDKATADALKPWYNQFCKRPCFHDEYLKTFNRPNVHLVDTHGRGVERITPNAVVVDGKAYEVDCLVYATGFEVGTSYARRAGYEVVGRGGVTLTDKCKNGVSTLHGMHVNGFPNLFVMSNSQSGFTVNYPHMLNAQAQHLSYIISECTKGQTRTVEATREAEEAWVQTIIDSALMRQKFQEECTPGYYNNEGKPSALAARNGPYGKGSIAFIELMEQWRAAGDMAGLEINRG